jgi:hypothetical protein
MISCDNRQTHLRTRDRHMTSRTSDHRVNPCHETISVGPLVVHFLITAEHSNGTVVAFELLVPAGHGLEAPAHSHDHYEETIYGIDGVLSWAVDGTDIDVGPGQAPPGCKGLVRDYAGRHWSAIFPGDCRGCQRGSRQFTRSREVGRNHAPPWDHPSPSPPTLS